MQVVNDLSGNLSGSHEPHRRARAVVPLNVDLIVGKVAAVDIDRIKAARHIRPHHGILAIVARAPIDDMLRVGLRVVDEIDRKTAAARREPADIRRQCAAAIEKLGIRSVSPSGIRLHIIIS